MTKKSQGQKNKIIKSIVTERELEKEINSAPLQHAWQAWQARRHCTNKEGQRTLSVKEAYDFVMRDLDLQHKPVIPVPVVGYSLNVPTFLSLYTT